MASHEDTARHLRTELAALEARLDSQNRLITALRQQLEAHENREVDERRTQVFRRAAIDIVPDDSTREFSALSPVEYDDMSEALIAISSRLDHKFAEIKALNEITERVTSGMFFDEVLDHVYENFQNLIPYDRDRCCTCRTRRARQTVSPRPMASGELRNALPEGRICRRVGQQ